MESLARGSSRQGSAGLATATDALARGRGCVAGGRPRVRHEPMLGCRSAIPASTGKVSTPHQLRSTTRDAASGDAGRQHKPTAPRESPLVVSGQASSRRGLLLGSAAGAAAVLAPWLGLDAQASAAAAGVLLHSRRSDVPCSLTIRNRSARVVEARWVNYDGDEEPYASIPPGHEWTVDTFETHPWRFRDLRTGSLVAEYVAARGPRLLQLTDTGAVEADSAGPNAPQGQGARQSQASDSRAGSGSGSGPGSAKGGGGRSPHGLDDRMADEDEDGNREGGVDALQPEPPATGLAGGFDGLGHPQSEYTLATLLSVGILVEQALVVLGLESFQHPLTLLVGLPEGLGVISAAGGSRSRRPSLLATWANTLQALSGKVERVVITRQVGGIYYARIVLSQPEQPEQPQQSQPRGVARGGAGSSGGGTGPRRIVSVDALPSAALALALEAGVDVFVSRPVAELVQRQYEDAERDLPDLLLPPPEGGRPGLGLDDAGQFAAGRPLRPGSAQLVGEAMSA